jgi:7-carboxy-7-deazaguanine synthase
MGQTAPTTDTSETKAKKHPVVELFGPVIQGEGSQAGQQTLFIRFGGCDYRCQKCDSLHAVLPEAVLKNSTWMEPNQIVEKCQEIRAATGCTWITFSGGNPCMHKLDLLVEMLTNDGFLINVETQGTLWQEWLYKCTMVTVSPKSPGMGEKFEEVKFRRFIGRLNGVMPICIKVVVFSAIDLEFALQIHSIVEDVKTQWLYENRAGIASYYLSLGNPYPPRLDDEMQVIPEQAHPGGSLQDRLLRDFKRMCEEILPDRRLKVFKFLPQLHVLAYGNEAAR